MVDPIADMLTRIRNAQAVKKDTVAVPFSKIKFALAKTLESRNYIKNVEMRGRKVKRTIDITLKYDSDREAAITGIKRISTSGQRVYRPSGELKRVKNGMGMAIVSTSAGIISDAEARKKNVGGEVLCEVW